VRRPAQTLVSRHWLGKAGANGCPLISHNDKLPPVFPAVVYNAEPPWGTAQDVAERIETVPGLMAYRSRLRYLLLGMEEVESRGDAGRFESVGLGVLLKLAPLRRHGRYPLKAAR